MGKILIIFLFLSSLLLAQSIEKPVVTAQGETEKLADKNAVELYCSTIFPPQMNPAQQLLFHSITAQTTVLIL